MLRRFRCSRALFASLLTALVLILGQLPAAGPVYAVTRVVNSLADTTSGSCSPTCTLRDALALSANGDIITFNVSGTILLTSQLTIATNVTITGPGAGSLAISGQNTVRVFGVNSGVVAQISGVTIRNGAAVTGGGIGNSGTLTLSNCVVRENAASGGAGIYTGGTLHVTNCTFSQNGANSGGAINNLGTLTVASSTVSGNTASDMGGGIWSSGNAQITTTTIFANSSVRDGGGIHNRAGGVLNITSSTLRSNISSTRNGGGIHSDGTLTSLVNSTVSGNTASRGGGIFLVIGTLTLLHTTVVGNTSADGSGIREDLGGSVSLRNSIVAANVGGANCLLSGALQSLGNNASDTTSCFAGGSQGDIVTAVPLVGALTVNSPGATATHALLPGSPAIDGVVFDPAECGSTIATDQRGIVRPQIQTSQSSLCDIGAFEREGNTQPTISAIADQVTPEDTATPSIIFTVGDAATAAGSLVVTATSANQTVVPNSAIQLGGSGAARSILLTPAANVAGTSLIEVTVSDGTATARENFTLTVTPVNDLPVAANDSYSVGATQALTVPAGTGVLANDTDIEASPLQAQLLSGPANGVLTLSLDGGFTYTPTKSFAGTDSFTYRALDGSGQSAPATVTLTVSATTCAPRASVKVTSSVVGGKLQATVEALPLDGQTNNRLSELRFGAFQNGRVTLNGQNIVSGQTYTVPTGTTQVSFTVERVTPGQATTIPLTAVDGCGSWPSFVGGGTGAGF